MTRWRLVRGPWDGQGVESWPARELLIPVRTVDWRLLFVVYTATGLVGDMIEAVYEGYREPSHG